MACLSLNLWVQEVWCLTAICYLIQNQNETGVNKDSCKGVSKKHRYKDVLNVFHKTATVSELEGEMLAKPRKLGFRTYN